MACINAVVASLNGAGTAIKTEPLAVRPLSGTCSKPPSLARASLPEDRCPGCGGVSSHRYTEGDDEKAADAAVTSVHLAGQLDTISITLALQGSDGSNTGPGSPY